VTATTALVLAGSRGPDDPLALHAGVSHKAMIEVGGEPMLVRVVRALAQAGFTRIVVAIERPELIETLAAEGRFPADAKVEALPAAAGPSLSVAQGLAALGAPLLVTTADHALLRPEWVRWFVDHLPPDADVAAGLARSDLVMAAAPEGKRTFLRFSDGAYSGCNLFYFATPAASRVVDLWQEVEAHRKQPVKLLRRLGPLTAARYALGALPLGEALNALGRLARIKAAVVEMPFGEAAIDVDKAEDLVLARRLAGR
jgi:GTP:adenosylcobinamide-phosphate guanylyltransferase